MDTCHSFIERVPELYTELMEHVNNYAQED